MYWNEEKIKLLQVVINCDKKIDELLEIARLGTAEAGSSIQ